MITFKPGVRTDADRWTLHGPKISSPDQLDLIGSVLEKDGPILLEHKFLRGARGPHVQVFDDFDEFVDYLTANARAGDNVFVWSLWPFMRDTAPIASGKCPADDGAVPEGGAY